MRNWFDIAVPHADIRKGDFDEAVFAAKLGDVVAGQAPEDYNDPFAFYKKTYLTGGLEHLLLRVSEKLPKGRGRAWSSSRRPSAAARRTRSSSSTTTSRAASASRRCCPTGSS